VVIQVLLHPDTLAHRVIRDKVDIAGNLAILELGHPVILEILDIVDKVDIQV
jgi:hypothetical protein